MRDRPEQLIYPVKLIPIWRLLTEARSGYILNDMVEYTETQLDQTFFALSNPTRRNLMERLARGEATVTELAEPYTMSLAAVSKHIQVLESAGLVLRRVEGREHHLSLDPSQLGKATSWLSHFQTFWDESFAALEALVEEDERTMDD